MTVSDTDAFSTARVVARRKGILLGGTSGAAVHAALKRLMLVEPNSTIVVLACDAGEKYLDTIYNDEWLQERSLLSESTQLSINQLFDAYQDSILLASKRIAA